MTTITALSEDEWIVYAPRFAGRIIYDHGAYLAVPMKRIIGNSWPNIRHNHINSAANYLATAAEWCQHDE